VSQSTGSATGSPRTQRATIDVMMEKFALGVSAPSANAKATIKRSAPQPRYGVPLPHHVSQPSTRAAGNYSAFAGVFQTEEEFGDFQEVPATAPVPAAPAPMPTTQYPHIQAGFPPGPTASHPAMFVAAPMLQAGPPLLPQDDGFADFASAPFSSAPPGPAPVQGSSQAFGAFVVPPAASTVPQPASGAMPLSLNFFCRAFFLTFFVSFSLFFSFFLSVCLFFRAGLAHICIIADDSWSAFADAPGLSGPISLPL
jgi:hypothetical protein